MKRRTFLILAGVAGGGLLIGCANPDRVRARADLRPAPGGQIAMNGWIKLAPDGSVTVVMSKSEMGQGVHTGLLMLVAEELDCAWSSLRMEDAPIEAFYGNLVAFAENVPFREDEHGAVANGMRWMMARLGRQLGFMMTGASSSLRDLWLPMRHAAAAARASLVAGVAGHWQCAPAEVQLQDGRFSVADGRAMDFAAAVAHLGAQPAPLGEVTLKSPAEFRLIGQPVPRLEAAAKVAGSARFGIDVRPPGLCYAALRFAPVRGGRVKTFDASKASRLPGVLGVVKCEPEHGGTGAVAVVASGWWRARQALAALEITWDDGPLAGRSTTDLMQTLTQALAEDDGHAFWQVGDADAVLAGSTRQVAADYRAPWLAHTPMEPMNCTVEYRGEAATVWAPTQVPGFARRAAARALDLAEDKVALEVTYLGGGFGRRLEVDFVAQAATIARAFPGRPVQTLWSREDDVQHDFYRPACVAQCRAALAEDGRIAAWQLKSAGQSIAPGYGPRTAGIPLLGPDKTTAEGAFDVAYAFPAVSVRHAAVELPLPVGFWRAVGHSHQAFFTECFMDECAQAAGADPLAYRLQLLAAEPAQRAVLQLAADKAGWGTPLAPAADGASVARGLALHRCFGSTVAQVAEVSLGEGGLIRVRRVVCAIDCGLAVNPNLIAQQMESAVVYGLSAALHGQIDFAAGRVAQGNFHDYPALRLGECPQIETHIVPSAAPPGGVGEPGLPPIAPAVANALFALTGQRRRSLPLQIPA